MFKIKMIGLPRTLAKLRKLDSEFPAFLEKTMLRTVLYIHGKIPPYPAPPPNSTYIRTGTLGRSMTSLAGSHPNALSKIEPVFGGVRGIVGTNIKYGPYVIDEGRQAKVHQGRWWTLQGVVRGLRDEIVDFWKASIRKFIDSL